MKESLQHEENLENIIQIKPTNSDNDKFVIVIGQFKVSSKEFRTPQEAARYLKKKPWEIIINVATLIAKATFVEGNEKFNNQKSEENGNN